MPSLSQRIQQLHASPIREILAVINQPGMISFAGGLPSTDSFPAFRLQQVPDAILQYGASEGEPALREQICMDLLKLGFACEPDQVLILSGSQQGIDLVAKLMIDAGTRVAVEAPTYLAALQVFRMFGARFVTLDRTQPQVLSQSADKPAMCYVIPTFQNPTGNCYTLQERQKLAAACRKHGTLLFEDDPYRDLVYDACDRQPVCTMMQGGSFVYQGSWSKTLAPGLRLGFLLASKELIPCLTRLKQAADLHSNRLSQWLVLQALQDPQQNGRILALQQHYLQKRNAFAEALTRHLSTHAQWELPAGGLFFWLKLHERTDTQDLLRRAIKNGVAFMPGEPFFHAAVPDASYLRLNFSHASIEAMEAGLKKIGQLLAQPTLTSAA